MKSFIADVEHLDRFYSAELGLVYRDSAILAGVRKDILTKLDITVSTYQVNGHDGPSDESFNQFLGTFREFCQTNQNSTCDTLLFSGAHGHSKYFNNLREDHLNQILTVANKHHVKFRHIVADCCCSDYGLDKLKLLLADGGELIGDATTSNSHWNRDYIIAHIGQQVSGGALMQEAITSSLNSYNSPMIVTRNQNVFNARFTNEDHFYLRKQSQYSGIFGGEVGREVLKQHFMSDVNLYPEDVARAIKRFPNPTICQTIEDLMASRKNVSPQVLPQSHVPHAAVQAVQADQAVPAQHAALDAKKAPPQAPAPALNVGQYPAAHDAKEDPVPAAQAVAAVVPEVVVGGNNSSEEFELRPMRVDDIDYIDTLDKEIFKGQPSLGKAQLIADFKDGLSYVMESKISRQVVGYIFVRKQGNANQEKWWINNIGVSESCAGKGLGKKLLETVTVLADQNNKEIELRVLRNNIKANSLYKKNGFEIKSTGQQYLRMSRVPKPFLLEALPRVIPAPPAAVVPEVVVSGDNSVIPINSDHDKKAGINQRQSEKPEIPAPVSSLSDPHVPGDFELPGVREEESLERESSSDSDHDNKAGIKSIGLGVVIGAASVVGLLKAAALGTVIGQAIGTAAGTATVCATVLASAGLVLAAILIIAAIIALVKQLNPEPTLLRNPQSP